MVNIAVAGCGYWGPNLVRNFKMLPDCEVTLVCDSNLNRLDYIHSLYKDIKTTTNYEEILADEAIDAIAIATPVRLHFEMAQQSLLAGKHTFIEKPMVSNVGQAEELIRLADKQNLTLMVGHTFIHSLRPLEK